MWQQTEKISVVLAFSLVFLTAIRGSWSVHIDIDPKVAIVLPGQSLSVNCKTNVPIQYCRFVITGLGPVNLNPNLPLESGVKYSGAGLEQGQCGVFIQQVDDKNNGIAKCTFGVPTELHEQYAEMRILVARPPKAPEMDISRGTESPGVFKVDDLLQASCIVRDGRPVANITWYLGNDKVTEGLSSPTNINGVDELQSIMQNLTRRLRPEDDGKLLRCVADHIALEDRTLQSSAQLIVKYKPQTKENPIDLFGYEMGRPGLVSIEFLANPRPLTQWTIGSTQVKEGTVDSTGRFEASSVEDLGEGHYKANLHIAEIKKEDTETPIKLTAYNEQGSTEYDIVISTSAEPQGLKFGAGPIIGILIAIMILLSVVFLIIYARASGRWCFGGGVVTNPNCESSDTESADVESQKKKTLTNLKCLFKKNKEPVIPEQEGEDTNTEIISTENEEQKSEVPSQPKGDGVVYAELDLVKSDSTKPVIRIDDDKTAYAEIIYPKNDSQPKPDVGK